MSHIHSLNTDTKYTYTDRPKEQRRRSSNWLSYKQNLVVKCIMCIHGPIMSIVCYESQRLGKSLPNLTSMKFCFFFFKNRKAWTRWAAFLLKLRARRSKATQLEAAVVCSLLRVHYALMVNRKRQKGLPVQFQCPKTQPKRGITWPSMGTGRTNEKDWHLGRGGGTLVGASNYRARIILNYTLKPHREINLQAEFMSKVDIVNSISNYLHFQKLKWQ